MRRAVLQEKIRDAYLQKSMLFHPGIHQERDRSHREKAMKRFREVGSAYETLRQKHQINEHEDPSLTDKQALALFDSFFSWSDVYAEPSEMKVRI